MATIQRACRGTATSRNAAVRPFVAAGPLRSLRSSICRPSWLARAEPESKTAEPQQQTSSLPDKEDLPPWVRRENERKMQAELGKQDLPWPLYLLFSTLVAIATVGSIFEYIDKNAVFGVLQPDSPAWAPVLLFMSISGLPMAGFLFYKGVSGANEAAELQDKMDGYIK